MMHETQPLVGWNPHLLQRDTYQQERRGHKKFLSPLLFSGSAGRWGGYLWDSSSNVCFFAPLELE